MTAYVVDASVAISIYDATYLALAKRLQGKMVTADEQFVRALFGPPWAEFVLRLKAVP